MPTHIDPIIAVIAAHREAAAALLAACDHCETLEENDPAWQVAKKAERFAYRAAERAALRLLAVQPRTTAGVAALLAHFAHVAGRDEYFVSGRTEVKLGAPFGVILAGNAAAALLNVRCAS